MSSIVRRIISTAKAPRPVAPYNQAIVLNNTVYLSGVLGLNKDTMKLVEGGAAEEARQALKYIGHILEAAGSSYESVCKTNIFLNDIADFGDVNEVYKEFFKKDFPARSTFQVGKLPMGAKVEIEVIAASGNVQTIPASKIKTNYMRSECRAYQGIPMVPDGDQHFRNMKMIIQAPR